ncbi:glycosyltransferase family 2 protein [Methanogenium sp. MK-MG]|uniref:glycosyltransferase family 2 protein n=1 Tax=Methanogenium sp. MK-MG TaxID=2599926 RepID=UPI0013ED4BBC|nr:glycosyltransferase family 2 protein [Methanogenium sp. MK-MG]KAF1075762.1 hypothetical protein MKMG_01649 [Methanogenium sp. MK-MG]
MHCPTLAELPPSPEGKTGWPWTEETPQIPETMSDGQPWPKVSIVTPSYNQGQFLEETIRSILLQGYPDLEYFIMDGGSTDESRRIIEKYDAWIDFWVSESDNGQTDALNKGFKRTTGEIAAWLNSDDVYTKGSMIKAINQFIDHPDISMIYGECQYIDEFGKPIFRPTYRPKKCDYGKLLEGCFIAQPSVFFKKITLEHVGYLNTGLQYCFDYDLWLSIARSFKIQYINSIQSKFRIHSQSKTGSQTMKFMFEDFKVIDDILRNYNDTGGAVFAAYNNLILRVVFARQDTLITGKPFEIANQGNERDPVHNGSSDDFFNCLISKKSTIDHANEGVKKIRYIDLFNELSGIYDIFDSRYQNKLDEEYTNNSYRNKVDLGIINIPLFCFNHGDYNTSKRVFQIIIHDHPIWIVKIPLLKYIFKKILKTFRFM